ncbi:MAG: M56 family metallopeptidase [Gemmatimonadaceae bacterium]
MFSNISQSFGPPSTETLVMLIKATVLLLIAMLGTIALRRSSAGLRHLVWMVTLSSLILLPSLIARLPWRLAVLPASLAPSVSRSTEPLEPSVNEQAPAPRIEQASPSAAPSDGVVREPVATPSRSLLSASPVTLALWLWVAGVGACLLWLLHGVWSVSRIVRRADDMTAPEWQDSLFEVADRIGLERAPRLVASRDISMPFACGLTRPVIVLPQDAHTWHADRRIAVLLHELAHIKRRDLVGHTLGRLACALYWFHPLVWTGARQLRIESERACDDIAIRCGARPSDYAEHLLDIVTTVRRQFTPAVALAMAHRKEFEGRMLAILDPDIRRTAPSRRQTAFSVASLALLALCVGAAAPAPASATTETAPMQADRTQPADTTDFHRPVASISRRSDTSTQTTRQTVTSVTTSEVDDSQGRDRARTGDRNRLDSSISRIIDDATRSGSKIAAETLRELFPTGRTSVTSQHSDERSKLLLNVLKTDTSATVRRIAAWGLQDYAGETAVAAALAEALRRDTNAEVREMAAWALGDADRDKVAADALVNAAKSDADEKVRATAIWALGEAGDESSLDVLTAALNAKDVRVREMAMWAIGSIEPDKVPAGVVAGLNDDAPQVRRLTAWVLFQIGDPSTVPALETAIEREKDPEVRRAYVRALGATGEKSADVLSKLIGSSDPEIRNMAVRALAGGGATGPWPWPWPRPRPNP